MRSDPTAEALLVFADTDIQSRRVIVDPRVGVISIGDFLCELEAVPLIESADFILGEAAEQGRNVERQRQPRADATTRERLREQLAREASQKQPTRKASVEGGPAWMRAEHEQSIQQEQEPDLDRERQDSRLDAAFQKSRFLHHPSTFDLIELGFFDPNF